MLIYKKKNFSRYLYLLFVGALATILVVFTLRAESGNYVTKMSDGEILQMHKNYVTGAVYDRTGKCIVKGDKSSKTGLKWRNKEEKKNFKDLLGMDIESTLLSGFTLAGHASVLFGTEDDRFTVDSLLQPFKERTGGSVKLTLDTATQQYITELIRSYGYDDENVYVVCSNYKTGEVKALNGPVFDTMLHPASTNKPIVLAAAKSVSPELVKNFTYDCNQWNHTFNVNGKKVKVRCAGGVTHGVVDASAAIKYSCNGYFISLLQKMDKKALLEGLEKMGMNNTIHFTQFAFWDGRVVSKENAKTNLKDEAYLLGSIGQADAFITPFNLNFLYSSLLNHGSLVEPYWISSTKSTPDSKWEDTTHNEKKQICDAEAADQVVNMMKLVTEEGTGTAFYMDNFVAKTGTAERVDNTGKLDGTYTVWTSGGLTDEKNPLSITVCIDKVDSSTTSAVPGKIARDILEYMTSAD